MRHSRALQPDEILAIHREKCSNPATPASFFRQQQLGDNLASHGTRRCRKRCLSTIHRKTVHYIRELLIFDTPVAIRTRTQSKPLHQFRTVGRANGNAKKCCQEIDNCVQNNLVKRRIVSGALRLRGTCKPVPASIPGDAGNAGNAGYPATGRHQYLPPRILTPTHSQITFFAGTKKQGICFFFQIAKRSSHGCAKRRKFLLVHKQNKIVFLKIVFF
jgi:hypothetical protein